MDNFCVIWNFLVVAELFLITYPIGGYMALNLDWPDQRRLSSFRNSDNQRTMGQSYSGIDGEVLSSSDGDTRPNPADSKKIIFTHVDPEEKEATLYQTSDDSNQEISQNDEKKDDERQKSSTH